jgi:hypothetical protein
MLGLSTAVAMFAFCSTTLPPLPQGQIDPKEAAKKRGAPSPLAIGSSIFPNPVLLF